jgi:hypothetical protein
MNRPLFLFAARLFRPFGAGCAFMSATHGLRRGLHSYAALRLFLLVCLSRRLIPGYTSGLLQWRTRGGRAIRSSNLRPVPDGLWLLSL